MGRMNDYEVYFCQDEEVEELAAVMAQSLNFKAADALPFVHRLGVENCRVVRVDDKVAAGLAI